VPDDVQRVGEIAVADGGPGFEGTFQQQKQVPGPLDGVGLAVEFDPAFAGCGFDAELAFEGLEVPGVVVVELLGDACWATRALSK